MMIKRTRQEIEALEGELLCDGGHRLVLVDGTVVDCVATKLAGRVAHVFTSRGIHAKYRYSEILGVRALDDGRQVDALVEAMKVEGMIIDED